MSAPSTPLTGDSLLDAVTDAIVEPHQSGYHPVPGTVVTMVLGGDLLACARGGRAADRDVWP
jgi:hypothetical protein